MQGSMSEMSRGPGSPWPVWWETQSQPPVFSSEMLVHRSCALPRSLCRRLYCWCWPLSFPQSLHLRSLQTCTLIPLDFSKQAINRVDSTFITRLLLTVKLNCATTCLFSTFHGEGRRTESCSTVLRISTLRRLLDYVHHNFSLGTNSKTNQTKKGEESPPLPQSNIVYKILLGKYLHFFFWILKAFP